MTAGRTQRVGEATVLDLVMKGDYAGLAKLAGVTVDQIERMLEGVDDDYDALDDGEEDDTGFFDEEDDDEDDKDDEDDEDGDALASRRRPPWLHADCLNVCTALELGTCCKYPDNPLVQCAVDA
jgi:hypothetical protein